MTTTSTDTPARLLQLLSRLREAMRKTVRGFVAAIGVSDRMVSKGEKGGENITPRPGNQAALDTLLARSGPEVQERFAQLMTAKAAASGDERTEALLTPVVQRHRRPVDGTSLPTGEQWEKAARAAVPDRLQPAGPE